MSEQHFETVADAVAYVQAHDAAVKQLSRMTWAELRAHWNAEMLERNITQVHGGPKTKEEHLSSILECRFPRIREAIHMVADDVRRRDHEQAVNELAVRLGTIQDEDLAEVLSRAHPAARQRLHEMTSVYASTAARYLDWPVDFAPGRADNKYWVFCKALRPGQFGDIKDHPTLCLDVLGEITSPRQLLELIRRHDQAVKHSDPAYETQ